MAGFDLTTEEQRWGGIAEVSIPSRFEKTRTLCRAELLLRKILIRSERIGDITQEWEKALLNFLDKKGFVEVSKQEQLLHFSTERLRSDKSGVLRCLCHSVFLGLLIECLLATRTAKVEVLSVKL
jgi:hypothetical protein